MLLAIDIGNTQTAFGIFNRNRLLSTLRKPTFELRTDKAFLAALKSLSKKINNPTCKISEAVIVSVVPRQTIRCRQILVKQLKVKPLMISAELDCGIIIRYDRPSLLGADRLCNAVAAYAKYGGPVIVVDFGTATKYEAISSRGEYLGGAISIGIGSAAEQLHKRTAKLPEIRLRFPGSVIASDTIGCMQSGILYGAVDAMEGIVRRFKLTIGKNARVIATGGFASLIGSHSRIINHTEPDLVLEGARLIYERQFRT